MSGSLLLGLSAAILALAPIPILLTGNRVVLASALAAATLSLSGGHQAGSHPNRGIAMLWTSCGILVALALVGMFSVGFAYLIAAIMTLMAISATPNDDGRSWFGLRFMLPEIAAFVATIAVALR